MSSSLSSPSLVSVATTSSATSSTPLRQSSSAPKDYSAAFGALQSQYGWGGPVQSPIQPATAPRPKEKKERRQETRSTNEEDAKKLSAPQEGAQASSGTKDFEAAHAALSSRFGFGGGWPTPKKQSKGKDGRS